MIVVPEWVGMLYYLGLSLVVSGILGIILENSVIDLYYGGVDSWVKKVIRRAKIWKIIWYGLIILGVGLFYFVSNFIK